METKTNDAFKPKRIEFYTPLMVFLKLDDCDDVNALLLAWREEYLIGKRLEMWNSADADRRQSRIANLFRWLIFIIKEFWPLIALAVMSAYLPFASICFASVVLLFAQSAIAIKFLMDLWEVVCIAGARSLGERYGDSERDA